MTLNKYPEIRQAVINNQDLLQDHDEMIVRLIKRINLLERQIEELLNNTKENDNVS